MVPSALKARIEEQCRRDIPKPLPRAAGQWLVEENDRLKRQVQVMRYALIEITELYDIHLDGAARIANKALKECGK